MATKRKGLPEVWPSGLAKWLAGDQTCGFALWFRAHHAKFEKRPSDFDFAAWRIAHTALLTATVQRLEADGWKVRLENANYFRVIGKFSILVGKPDITARKQGVTKVVDCKSGEPKDAHAIQVAIYQVGLAMAWNEKLFISGEVVYPTHTVEVGPERGEELKPRLFAALREFGAPEPLSAQPSERECRFCDLTVTDCPVRFAGAAEEPVTTEMF